MTIAVTDIGSNGSTSGASVAITNVTVPSGSLIVVGTFDANTTLGGAVDDGGTNTYTSITSKSPNAQSTRGFAQIFSAFNTTAISAATLTYTKQATGANAVISAFYATGIQTSSTPVDSAVTATASGNAATVTVTSGTPGVAGELIAGLCCFGSATFTQTYNQDTGNGFATPFDAVRAGSTAISVGGGDLINSGSSAVTFAPTITGTASPGNWGLIIVGFKPAAGGGATQGLFVPSILAGLGSGGPFFQNPLGRSMLGWRPSHILSRILMPHPKLIGAFANG